MPHDISPIDAERPSTVLEQSQFAPPRFHLSSSSSPRLDTSNSTSSPPIHADSPYNLANYNSSSASSPALSHLSSRPTTASSSTSLSTLAADLSFHFPDQHHPSSHLHVQSSPLASSSSLVFQPPPQPGVSAPKKKKTHSKPRPEGHVPRPRNPFIMFRMDVVEKKLITSENKHQNISKVVADMWKALTPEEKEPYLAAAKQEKDQHKIMYPNYIYQPIGDKVVEGGKSPKRVSGSKASLKAAAIKEKRAMEEKQRRTRMQQHGEVDEVDDDDEYVSSSTSKSKKRTRPTSKKSRPKASRPVSSSSNSHSDHSFEDEDADFYPDARSRPVIPIRSTSSRGGRREHSSGLSSSSFSSQGTQWESSTDEGTDPQRMGMSDRGLRVGYAAGGRGYGGAEGREGEEGDELEPSLRHYQQPIEQQPTYSYPNQQQQHYQPEDGQLTYSTYSDYPMPTQLSSNSSFPNSSIQTPSLIPFNPQLSHSSSFRRPHSGGSEFLPTAAPSPLTPGFPNLPTPGLQGHRRRGSSLSSSMRYGLDDGLTPRTRTFWESAPSEVASSSMGPPVRTRGHRGAGSVELSELFTREPLQSPRARESASRSQLRENWHMGSDAAFIHPPMANGVNYSNHIVPHNQQHLPPRPSTTPSYSSHPFNPASIHEIPSPPRSDESRPLQSQYPTVGSASLNLSTRRKGRPQALSLLSKSRPQISSSSSLSAISNSNTQSSGFSHEEQTPTQASFDGQDASYSVNRPYEDQNYGMVGMDQSGGYQGEVQDQGPSSGNSMVFDDEWRPKVDYIPFVEAPWFIQ